MASILKVDTIQDQSGNNIINENADTITIGASGDTIAIPTGATLTVPNGKITGHNYPAFYAYLSSSQSVTDNVLTKAQIDTEVFDTDNCYDNSVNYRFTPNVAGKYFVYACIGLESLTSGKVITAGTFIYKNGVLYTNPQFSSNTPTLITRVLQNTIAVVDMNGTTDYLEIFGTINVDSGNCEFNTGTKQTYFGAFRIGA